MTHMPTHDSSAASIVSYPEGMTMREEELYGELRSLSAMYTGEVLWSQVIKLLDPVAHHLLTPHLLCYARACLRAHEGEHVAPEPWLRCDAGELESLHPALVLARGAMIHSDARPMHEQLEPYMQRPHFTHHSMCVYQKFSPCHESCEPVPLSHLILTWAALSETTFDYLCTSPPHLAHLSRLSFHGVMKARVGGSSLDRLFRSELVSRLTHLHGPAIYYHDSHVLALCSSHARLKSLTLYMGDVLWRSFNQLVTSHVLSQLETICMSGQLMREESVRADLVRLFELPMLRHISLFSPDHRADYLSILLNKSCAHTLDYINLSYKLVTSQEVEELTHTQHVTLILNGNVACARTLHKFQGSPFMKRLEVLDLSECRLELSDMDMFCGEPLCPHLKTLCLRGNRLDDRTSRVLARAPYFGQLTRLDLSDNRLTGGCLEYLRVMMARGLNYLDLSGNALDYHRPDTKRVLREMFSILSPSTRREFLQSCQRRRFDNVLDHVKAHVWPHQPGASLFMEGMS